MNKYWIGPPEEFADQIPMFSIYSETDEKICKSYPNSRIYRELYSELILVQKK